MAKLHMLKSIFNTINTSFILQTEGSLIVIDGGFGGEADYLYPYLKELGGKVDGWFFTHLHTDHICAALEIFKKPDIEIKKCYFNFPSDEFLNQPDFMQDTDHTTKITYRSVDLKTLLMSRTENVIVQPGDTYEFDGFEVSVLLVGDEKLARDVNDTSVVYRITVNGKTLLFFGDLGVSGGKQLLEKVPPELLRADYVQMAHHGQKGVTRDVYEAIKPENCFWCTPSWLWDNIGPGGYDTGDFLTVVTRGWMSEMGCVKKHYLMTEGTHVIEL